MSKFIKLYESTKQSLVKEHTEYPRGAKAVIKFGKLELIKAEDHEGMRLSPQDIISHYDGKEAKVIRLTYNDSTDSRKDRYNIEFKDGVVVYDLPSEHLTSVVTESLQEDTSDNYLKNLMNELDEYRDVEFELVDEEDGPAITADIGNSNIALFVEDGKLQLQFETSTIPLEMTISREALNVAITIAIDVTVQSPHS